jgi:hypothetical protein
MKIIIYSVNIGGYDMFKNPKNYDPNVRYILFTDNKYFKSDIWEVNHIDFIDSSLDSRLKARYLKTNPHKVLPNHDISIWIDHCFDYKFTNVEDIINDIGFKNENIMLYKHEERKCIYREGEKVIEMNLEIPQVVERQMLKYQTEGFPENFGLYQSGFMFRKNNKKVNEFNEVWWNEIKNHSGRDQLSQVYASWKVSLPIGTISGFGTVYSNKFLFPKVKHTKRWTPK